MSECPGIDPNGLVRLNKLGGPAFVTKMIDLFLTEAPARMASAHQAAAEGNLPEVAHAAHSLKSSAYNFGAVELSTIAEKLELQIGAGKCEDLPGQLVRLESAFGVTKTWLEGQREHYRP